MLHLSPLYRIDPGFNSKDEKMYRFDSFACGFPVLIEFFCLYLGFGCGFAVSNKPQYPLIVGDANDL